MWSSHWHEFGAVPVKSKCYSLNMVTCFIIGTLADLFLGLNLLIHQVISRLELLLYIIIACLTFNI